MEDKSFRPLFTIPVIVAALGYFVDIYDLLLFSIVRRPSLLALGVPESSLLSEGEFLLQVQMTGLLVGGIIWESWVTRRDGFQFLFGSILLYSLSNCQWICNGCSSIRYFTVHSRNRIGRRIRGWDHVSFRIASYTAARLWYNTRCHRRFVRSSCCHFVVRQSDWRTAFFYGGGLGLMLLIARISVFESSIFLKVKEEQVQRGNFFMLFTKREDCFVFGLHFHWHTHLVRYRHSHFCGP